jgi:hypothetical protein
MKRGVLMVILVNLYFNAIGQNLFFCGTQNNNSFFSYNQSSGASNTIQIGQTLIRRVRVDQNTGKVYWSAGGLNKIQKVDANPLGTNRVDVKTNITNVSTINVDGDNNKVYYYLPGGTTIFSCDTNGANTVSLVNLSTSSPVLGIEIDNVSNFIYWSELTPGTRSIKRADLLTGVNITTIYSASDFIFDIKLIKEDSSILFTNRNGNRLQKIKTDGTGLITLVSEASTATIGTVTADFCNNSIYYFLSNSGNGLQIKQTDFQGSLPSIILDTTVSGLSGFDVFFEFNIGTKNNFLGTDITICEDSIELNTAVNGATYIWNTGETAARIWVKQTGNYGVTVNLNNCSKFDTINVTLSLASSLNLGADTLLCFGDSIILSATTPNATYLWSDNSTNATLKIKQPGLYWVDRTESACTSRDSIQVQFGPNIQPSIGPDTNLCAGDSITLIASVSVPSATYLWNSNSTRSELKVKQSGIYSVTVTDNNCSKVDSIYVNSRL